MAAALGIAIATELSSDDKQQALLAGMYRNPEQIAKLTSEQRDYLNELILAGDDSLLGNQVWIPNASGGFSPMDPSLVTINTGGKQIIDPRIVITNTGEVQYPTNNDLPRHTDGNQVIENDKTDHILTGSQTQIGDWRDHVLFARNKDTIEEAGKLGYKRRIPPQKAPFNSHGQPVYWNGKNYITPDIDSHNVTCLIVEAID